jgi:hypothetical protein
MDDSGEPFGMPFRNPQVAVIVAHELNQHDPSLWFYNVERHIDDKRWIIVRKVRELDFPQDLASQRGVGGPKQHRRAGCHRWNEK